MKFTKEQAVEQLKGLLTEGGKTLHLSDRTINENIDDLIPLLANDETELSDFISKALPFVKRTNANFEKEKADFIKSYKPTQSQTTQQQQSKTPPTDDDALSQLQAQIQQLQDKIEREEKEKALSQVRKNFKSELKSAGIKDDKWIDTYISKIQISEDLDIKEEAKSTLELYNLSRVYIPDRATPYKPIGGDPSKSKISWDDVKNEK